MKTREQSTVGHATQPENQRRRQLLRALAAGAGVSVLGLAPWTRGVAATEDGTDMVRIVVFNHQGERVGLRERPKVVRSEAEWREKLSSLAYRVTRESGTERSYSGDYTKPEEPGIYRCIGCDTALYDAATQFHSGTGWPSFWQPIAKENVSEHVDTTLGMRRTEISCTRCDSHLGHVFNDGPEPTGLRYCMNSAALHFEPKAGA